MKKNRRRKAEPGGEKDVPPKIYTARDLAEILQYDAAQTIYRMLRKGELPEPLPFGRTLRWDGNKFDEWVRNGCPKPAGRRQQEEQP
jgi:predicted DNA-binding transcriptional regulator AlpA